VALEAEVRNRWVLEGMLRMEYAAINIGELEVIKETDRWSELEKVAELPFISANAVVPAGSHPKFPPYVIREVEIFEGRSIRVGLLGLADPESGSLAIEFADPVEKARELVADLDGKCDVLVVLAQLPLPAAKELVKAVPAIDVLVGAANETHLPKPSLEGDTLICYPYPQGMGLGELRLFFDQDGRPARFFYRLVPLSSQLKDHPDFVEFQQKAEAEIEAAKSQ
jgi:2',3'-cyclic-nucleotide 2'-phosphodiesterase (5'-nucleotidase family)